MSSETLPKEVEWRYLTYETSLPTLTEANGLKVATTTPSAQEPDTLQKYRNPRSWSPARKWLIAWFICLGNFATTWNTAAYPPGASQMSKEWHVSEIAVYVAITTYSIGFAVFPMALAPFSELTGRYPVIAVTGALWVVLNVCNAADQVYWGMVLSRFLVGGISSVFAVVTVGIVAEVFEPVQRRTPMAIFAGGAFFGSGFGPLISGFIAMRLGWRWTFWVFAMYLGVFMVVSISFLTESRQDVLLSRKAKALNKWYDACERETTASESQELDSEGRESSNEKRGPLIRWKAKADDERKTLKQIVSISLTRPFVLLVREPVVFFFSLWATFAWSVLYGLLVIIAYTFETQYGFSSENANAVFASMCIAAVLSTILAIYQEDIVQRLFPQLPYDVPEARLYPVCATSILLPIGLFMYGWTAQYQIHWIVPTIAVGIATMGMFSIYLAVFSYLSDAYGPYASSANAAQNFCRNFLAGSFPLFIRAMFKHLGFGGAASLLGAVGVVLTGVPWVLVLYGTRIREKSEFAVKTRHTT